MKSPTWRTFNEMLDRLSEAFAAQRVHRRCRTRIAHAAHDRAGAIWNYWRTTLCSGRRLSNWCWTNCHDEPDRARSASPDEGQPAWPSFTGTGRTGGLPDELLVKAGAPRSAPGTRAPGSRHRGRRSSARDAAMLQLAANAARHSPHDGSIHIGDASWVTPWSCSSQTATPAFPRRIATR